jgi:hypothetical protein
MPAQQKEGQRENANASIDINKIGTLKDSS